MSGLEFAAAIAVIVAAVCVVIATLRFTLRSPEKPPPKGDKDKE